MMINYEAVVQILGNSLEEPQLVLGENKQDVLSMKLQCSTANHADLADIPAQQ